MSEKRTEARASLRQRFAERYGESAEWNGKDSIVIHGQCGVTVHGCRRIVLYSPCEIRLRTGRRTVAITGTCLFCTSFSAGTVTVSGRVAGVLFVDEEARGC